MLRDLSLCCSQLLTQLLLSCKCGVELRVGHSEWIADANMTGGTRTRTVFLVFGEPDTDGGGGGATSLRPFRRRPLLSTLWRSTMVGWNVLWWDTYMPGPGTHVFSSLNRAAREKFDTTTLDRWPFLPTVVPAFGSLEVSMAVRYMGLRY